MNKGHPELLGLCHAFPRAKWSLWCAHPVKTDKLLLNSYQFFSEIFLLTRIIFKASGESMSTQWSTSNIPVPSPDAWEPNLEKSQFNLFELANWAQFVWFPLIIAARNKKNNLIRNVSTNTHFFQYYDIKDVFKPKNKPPHLKADKDTQKSFPNCDLRLMLIENLEMWLYLFCQ